jgi:endonuclease/exonuclease/phosphatase family metal-dependent hydrolase
MEEIEAGSFVSGSEPRVRAGTLKVVCWNINRGLQLNAVLDFLAGSSADLILLQETDVNARRTQRRNIPREIAQALQMNYVFGREFKELAQGQVSSPAYHGQATLSRFPLLYPHLLRFRCQSAFWRPRWFIPSFGPLQRRLGGRIALICNTAVQGRTLAVYNTHLESRGGDHLRTSQLSEMVSEIERDPQHARVFVGGDFNFDLSRGSAANLITNCKLTSPLIHLGGRPTTRSRLGKSAALDWILTGKGLIATSPEIHYAIGASDHYPISLRIELL